MQAAKATAVSILAKVKIRQKALLDAEVTLCELFSTTPKAVTNNNPNGVEKSTRWTALSLLLPNSAVVRHWVIRKQKMNVLKGTSLSLSAH